MSLDPLPPEIAEMAAARARFMLNHSGGKDSQAMAIHLRALVPLDQLVVIHAPLGRVEWPGTLAHIRATTRGLPLVLAEARTDLLAMVRPARLLAEPGDPAVHLGSEARPDRALNPPVSEGEPALRRPGR